MRFLSANSISGPIQSQPRLAGSCSTKIVILPQCDSNTAKGNEKLKKMWAQAVNNGDVWQGQQDGEIVLAYKKPTAIDSVDSLVSETLVDTHSGLLTRSEAEDALANQGGDSFIAKVIGMALGNAPGVGSRCASQVQVDDIEDDDQKPMKRRRLPKKKRKRIGNDNANFDTVSSTVNPAPRGSLNFGA